MECNASVHYLKAAKQGILGKTNNLYIMGKIVSKTVFGVYAPLIKDCKNLILRGAPGTGKTYLAKQLAAYLVEGSEWNPSSPLQKERICFVQFHPSYDYTDFVEGLRPAENGTFVRQDGIFKEFCKKALNAPKVASNKSNNAPQVTNTNSTSLDFKIALFAFIGDCKNRKVTLIPYEKAKGGYAILKIDETVITVQSPINNKCYDLVINELLDFGQIYISRGRKEFVHRLEECSLQSKNKSLLMAAIVFIHNEYMPNDSDAIDTPVQNEEEKDDTAPSFVFIIDEINRGEISRIFGELFFSIDPDYRGEAGRVKTQYNNMVPKGDVFEDGFFVPENIYIIGTMNDIDRGVECIDFAMHRRFLFKEVTVDDSISEMGITGDAKKKMDALNKAITDIGNLPNDYHIGGSYFRKAKTGADFQALWDNRLGSLIKEYLRGNPRMDEQYKEIEKAFKDQKSN